MKQMMLKHPFCHLRDVHFDGFNFPLVYGLIASLAIVSRLNKMHRYHLGF